MSTYQKAGQIHGVFDLDRYNKFEKVGRSSAILFWEQRSFKATENDIKDNGTVDTTCTDLKVWMKDKSILVEAATKRYDLFRYINMGVDIETRKLKYFRKDERAFVAMCDYLLDQSGNAYAGNEMLIIPMECLFVAQRDCLSEYFGHRPVSSSLNFIMPEHGCHRVRKNCGSGYHQTGAPEDFYRVPYDYISHFRKNETGDYILISRPSKKINI